MMTNRKRGYLYILLAAMLYSTTEVALKALGGAFAPMQVTVERVLLGALALLPFALKDLKKRGIHLTKSDWGYFALLGFLTVTLHMSLLQMAVLHMDASATSVIYSGNPVFALAAAHLILHEPLKKNHPLFFRYRKAPATTPMQPFCATWPRVQSSMQKNSAGRIPRSFFTSTTVTLSNSARAVSISASLQ